MLKCDIVIALFYKKVGQFTKEEFDIAYKSLKEGNNPQHIFVFFKEPTMTEINKDTLEEALKVIELKEEIEKAKQIYNTFSFEQDLILKLKNR
jgi:hypothetical protein